MRTCKICHNRAIGQDPVSLYWAYDGLCVECYDKKYECPKCHGRLHVGTGVAVCENCEPEEYYPKDEVGK